MIRCPLCGGSGFNPEVTESEIEELGESAYDCLRCDGAGRVASI